MEGSLKHQELNNKIRHIKQKYRFNIKTVWKIQEDVFRSYGYPSSIDHIKEGFLVLYRQWPSCVGTLILYDPSFSFLRIIYQSPLMYKVCPHPPSESIFILETNFVDYVAKLRKKAYNNPGNRIIRCDLDGKIKGQWGGAKGESFFPTDIAYYKNDTFVYYDLAQNRLWQIDSAGNRLQSFFIGEKFLRRIRCVSDREIFFISSLKLAWLGGIDIMKDPYDILFSLRLEKSSKPVSLYRLLNENNGSNHFYDIECVSDAVLLARDSSLIKFDYQGNIVFDYSLQGAPVSRNFDGNSRITNLNRSTIDPLLCYGILEGYREKQDFYICRLEI
jgi:hypothetical protein